MKIVTNNRTLEFESDDLIPFFLLEDDTLCVLTKDGLEEVISMDEDTSDDSI